MPGTKANSHFHGSKVRGKKRVSIYSRKQVLFHILSQKMLSQSFDFMAFS